MATALQLKPEATQSHLTPLLLSLSGELRNQIYSYCTGDGPSDGRDEFGTTYNVTKLSKRPSSSQPREAFRRRPFFGLTQINRSLREEFRPLYMQTNQVHVSINELTPFLETFFPKVLASSEELRVANYYGHVVVFDENYRTVTGDLTHVLALRTHAPEIGFQVKAPYSYPSIPKIWQIMLLNLLLSNELCSLVRCHRWSYEAISRFEVAYPRHVVPQTGTYAHGQVFTVTFKRHARRKWMDGETRNPRFLARLIRSEYQKGDDIDGPFMNVLFGAHARFHNHEWFVRAVVEQ